MSFKSYQKMMVLFGKYSNDSIPPTLVNVINSVQDLFEVLRNIKEEDIRVSEASEIILTLKMFMLKREYSLPL